jgi:hypothetical protein
MGTTSRQHFVLLSTLALFTVTSAQAQVNSQAPAAIHFVVFDACRNELQLRIKDKKAFEVDGKGFMPVAQSAGTLVAYSTAPRRTASDAGEGSGPYARALAEELARPGFEAVVMFRNVQLRVKQSIGQDPWLSFPGVPAVYFAGERPTDSPPSKPDDPQAVFMRERASVKNSLRPVLAQLGSEGILSSGVIDLRKKWPGPSIKMCFLDGGREVRAHVASIARQWTLHGEIDFDFGNWDDPRACRSEGEDSDVRITFAQNGNWSFIGTDSRTFSGSDNATLSLESLRDVNLEKIKGAAAYGREILHEFGHVLGFDHNWRAAGANCDKEMNWDYIYENFLRTAGWDKHIVDDNLRSLNPGAHAPAALDKKSVMNWDLPAEFFVKGKESSCWLEPRDELSLRDKLAVFTAYR